MDIDSMREAVLTPFRNGNYVVADSILVYLASSPPLSYRKGGVIAGCFSKKRTWNAYTNILKAIPSEFRSIKSRYYYDYSFNPPSSINVEKMNPVEINLDYVNPKNIHVHFPQNLIGLDTRPKSEYSDWIKELKPLIRASIIQSLLLTPKPNKKAEKVLVEGMYDVHEKLLMQGKLPFKPDLTGVQRVIASIARLELRQEITPDKVKEAVEFWLQAYEESLKITSRAFDYKAYYKLDEREKLVYNILWDTGELELDRERIYEECRKFLALVEIEAALDELNKLGLVLLLPSGRYVITEKWIR